MSIGEKAVRGGLWSVGVSLSVRAFGMLGTLVMTRLLHPAIVGEVSATLAVAQTANWISHWGFNQYMIVHGTGDDDRTYHVAVVNLALGAAGLALAAGLGTWLGSLFRTPTLSTYLPGMVLAVFLRRLGAVADKVLVRDLRFRELAIANGAGELAFTLSSLALAATTDLGGMAIVLANILQSCLTSLLIFRATGLGWLRRVPWRWQRVAEIVRFGAPLGVAQVAAYGARSWDNLAFSTLFGPSTLGLYNMAYNLADVPAAQVGEQMTGVLMPAMNRLGPEERKAAVTRGTSLMALVVFPMGAGLGAVAPTLIGLLLDTTWQGVAPLLVVLSPLSVVRPISWGVESYLMVQSKTQAAMFLSILKVALLFACIAVLADAGPLWTAAAVVLAFGLHGTIVIGVVCVSNGIPLSGLAWAVLRPLGACAVMVVGVLAARVGLREVGVHGFGSRLLVEVGIGVACYVPAALLLAPGASRELLPLLRRALRSSA